MKPAAAAEPKADGPRKLTLVDASGFIFRAYHALPPLTTSKGVPSHAVLGFTRMLLKLIRERSPTHLVLCFDKDSRKGRLQIDPNYKANREAPPDDLLRQFSTIRKCADVLNLPIVEVEGWEADDVIATLTRYAREQGWNTEVVTSDKDFLQIWGDGVTLYDPMKDKMIDEASCLERYGVKPSQMRDYLALVGDAIDNVPKVPGIGPKTAVELIEKFHTVEELISRVDEVGKPKIRQSLKDHVEGLRRAHQLIGFKDDLNLDHDLEQYVRRDIKAPEARALFTEMEFFVLLKEMPQAPATPLAKDPVIVADAAGLVPLAAALENAEAVAVAPAFEGAAHSALTHGLGLALQPGGVFYLDVKAAGAEAVVAALSKGFARPELKVLAHDAKAVLHLFHTLGLPQPQVDADVELLSYLLNPSRREHALAELARERLRTELPAWPEASTRAKLPLEAVGRGTAAAIFAASADAISRLAPELWEEARVVGMADLALQMELPLIPVLYRMERHGVRIDLDELKGIATQVDALCEQMLAEVYKHAGREFNVGSPLQLAQVLYDDLKLPVLKRTKTGPSTDQEVLEKLADQHPLPGAITEYRSVAKLKSTYLDTLPGMVGQDGRIRTTFHQALAATGRLSSVEPNLQNIPIRTELGRQIRRAFVAEPGWKLVSADYSQIELRILAHICGDAALVEAFGADADVHARTAAEVFGVPLEQVTKAQRNTAKMVNYGIAYGLSPHGLATRLNIPVDEARAIIDRYFERFTGIRTYVSDTLEKVRKTGYVETLFGRRRYLPDLVSRNRSVSMAAERAAINMPIQGTAADIVKRAMLELDKRLNEAGRRTRMLLQVHDELLFEAPEAEAESIAELARTVMSSVAELKVPLRVDVGIGHSWAEAH
ncbi:MAG: DNA polymerase I [Archangiaceae bacterium]|nr:DNA polymerase I [Archangiaceae bacterium]